MDHRDAAYQTYAEFKAWTGAQASADGETYSIELRRAGLKLGAKILEIGFGDGQFLDWAAKEGYDVAGVEIIEELVTSARRRGTRCSMESHRPL